MTIHSFFNLLRRYSPTWKGSITRWDAARYIHTAHITENDLVAGASSKNALARNEIPSPNTVQSHKIRKIIQWFLKIFAQVAAALGICEITNLTSSVQITVIAIMVNVSWSIFIGGMRYFIRCAKRSQAWKGAK